MNTFRIRSALEIISSCAALLLVAIVTSQFVLLRTNQSNQSNQAARRSQGPKKGMVIEKAKGLTDRDRTLVVAMSSRCKFCAKSLPFIADMSHLVEQNKSDSKIVAVFPEGDPDSRSFLSRANVNIPITSGLTFTDFGVRVTPTYVLLNREARVVEVWVGQLSKPSMDSVKHALD